jgi:hypothetical protein
MLGFRHGSSINAMNREQRIWWESIHNRIVEGGLNFLEGWIVLGI